MFESVLPAFAKMISVRSIYNQSVIYIPKRAGWCFFFV